MTCHSRTSQATRKARPPDPAIDDPKPAETDYTAYARRLDNGLYGLDLMVPDIHCAGCIKRIENALNGHEAVSQARVNMSTKRVSVHWRPRGTRPVEAGALAGIVEGLGFKVHPFDAEEDTTGDEAKRSRELLLALAVAGFAASNVMLLSVSVWSGAPEATRTMFHWISALIALPAAGFAGRPFFRSAWGALKGRSLNMDVPISLAVILACAMSLYETVTGGAEAYFDAAVMLLFFLLVGRYLDHLMRAKARSAVSSLLSLTPKSASVVDSDGTQTRCALADLEPGMVIAVAAGERLPADGVITQGTSDFDLSAMTGESAAQALSPGDAVHAGTLNLTGDVQIRITACGGETLLSEIVAMMEKAEQTKARYVRLADMAARIYAPAVHGIAALTFIGWLVYSGGDWHLAMFNAIAVLIITCPCALGLAVPVVQIIASGVLFRNGILLKDGAALERLAEIDTVVFDKTGTLTLGRPTLVSPAVVDVDQLALAAGLARHSNHPLSRAITSLAVARSIAPLHVEDVEEQPGFGISGIWEGKTVCLGRRTWCAPGSVEPEHDRDQLELCLRTGSGPVLTFIFEDELRSDARAVADELKECGLKVEILSGDRAHAVDALARKLGIDQYRAQWTPDAKAEYITMLVTTGKRVLMVGDGLNDAPALAAGHASMAPSSATDAGRMAADCVFLGDRLRPVIIARHFAILARRLVMQNFGFAAAYNLVAVPLAILGFASPLVAAIAMSASSLVVTANALRLRLDRHARSEQGQAETPTASGDRRDDRSAA